MIPLIDEHRAELNELCRRHHVKTLELFGSAADGTFDPNRSDLDFLIEFSATATGRFHLFFELQRQLEALFGRKVDLVMPSAITNPYLLNAINEQRQVLYAA